MKQALVTGVTGQDGSPRKLMDVSFLLNLGWKAKMPLKLGLERSYNDFKFVLVTGGVGYIDSHACNALHKDGYTPVTIDNLSTGWSDAVMLANLK